MDENFRSLPRLDSAFVLTNEMVERKEEDEKALCYRGCLKACKKSSKNGGQKNAWRNETMNSFGDFK